MFKRQSISILWFIYATIALAIVASSTLIWLTFTIQSLHEQIDDTSHKALTTVTAFRVLDLERANVVAEVLLTGEATAIDKYARLDEEWIRQVDGLKLDAFISDRLRMVVAARRYLAELDHQAMQLAMNGTASKQASAVLYGPQYGLFRQSYETGMTHILRHVTTVSEELKQQLDEQIAKSKLLMIATLLGAIALGAPLLFLQHRVHAQLLSMNERLKDASEVDQLTGLANRRRINKMLQKEFDRYRRYQHPFSVVIGDIDLFKIVNDTLGHNVGDEVLHQVAQILESHTRSADVACRWGGEEFLLVLPETSEAEAAVASEKLRAAIAQHDFGINRRVTMSFGVAEVMSGEEQTQLISRADDALYRAKSAGRNCVVACTDEVAGCVPAD